MCCLWVVVLLVCVVVVIVCVFPLNVSMRFVCDSGGVMLYALRVLCVVRLFNMCVCFVCGLMRFYSVCDLFGCFRVFVFVCLYV